MCRRALFGRLRSVFVLGVPQEARRVEDEDEFGRYMDEGGRERIEESERCEADTKAVDRERPDKVRLDDPVTASRELQCVGKRRELRNIRMFLKHGAKHANEIRMVAPTGFEPVFQP